MRFHCLLCFVKLNYSQMMLEPALYPTAPDLKKLKVEVIYCFCHLRTINLSLTLLPSFH